MKTITSELLKELHTYRNQAGENHYTRLQLVQKILSDREWVAATEGGGGSLDRALTRLEATYFADLCSYLTLCQLLEILHHVPDISIWRKNKFNLRKMHAEYTASKKPTPRPRPQATFVNGHTRGVPYQPTQAGSTTSDSVPSTLSPFPTPAEFNKLLASEQQHWYTKLYAAYHKKLQVA